MKIRSITYFDSIRWPIDRGQIHTAGEFIKTACRVYQDQGYEVQTTRLASAPFAEILEEKALGDVVNYAVSLEKCMADSGFDYASIGPAMPSMIDSYRVIPDVIASTQKIFSAGIISAADQGIFPRAIKQCAEVITRNAKISPDGFGNLRFAALANIPAGSPFLPAAYSDYGREPGFAIATEAADLAVAVFDLGADLETCRLELINTIESTANDLALIGTRLASQFGIHFMGVDFSLAPFPTTEQSIGTAVEKMGVKKIGKHGSLAAIALLAEALDRAEYQKVGFNGIMLPVLEDTALAASAAGGVLTVNDLLLYSAVCGTGLDTVPLPGSTTKAELYAVLLDLAWLAQRLDKPLTARLMPIPGKAAGQAQAYKG